MADDVKYYFELFAGDELIARGELEDDRVAVEKLAADVACGAADTRDDVSFCVVSTAVVSSYYVDEDGTLIEAEDEEDED